MKKNMIILGGVLLLVVTMVIGTMVGLSNTVGDLSVEMNRNHIDAVLASANVEDDSIVKVPILYYDQMMDDCINIYNSGSLDYTRQFEWSTCGYYHKALEKELTEPELDENYLPILRSGNLLSNRGLGEGAFRWFNTVEGKSKNYAGNLNFRYTAGTATFSYENDNFYPLNELAVSAESVNKDGNNHLFTLNLGVPFEVTGEGKESFTISADDDTWVFIDNKIVLDMGGVHGVMTGRFKVQEDGEVYTAVGDESLAYSGVKLERGNDAVVRIFHADRDSAESVFRINFSNMLVKMTDATLAQNNGASENSDGDAMVAYNPNNPDYVAPLGETTTYTPNRSRMILTSVITQASVMGALVVVVMVVISVVWRYVRRSRN